MLIFSRFKLLIRYIFSIRCHRRRLRRQILHFSHLIPSDWRHRRPHDLPPWLPLRLSMILNLLRFCYVFRHVAAESATTCRDCRQYCIALITPPLITIYYAITSLRDIDMLLMILITCHATGCHCHCYLHIVSFHAIDIFRHWLPLAGLICHFHAIFTWLIDDCHADGDDAALLRLIRWYIIDITLWADIIDIVIYFSCHYDALRHYITLSWLLRYAIDYAIFIYIFAGICYDAYFMMPAPYYAYAIVYDFHYLLRQLITIFIDARYYYADWLITPPTLRH